ncbi:MAG: MFS transporter, partial [Chlamydiia bacterium]|nr:MFS transporter [Chlamydiia bacterium]
MLQQLRSFFTRQCSSLTYLNVTQFLGAMNDNIFKLVIAYYLIDIQGAKNSETILATAGAVFVLPFLLFSASSGTLADRWSKRNIIVSAKFLEVLIMALGIWAFQVESPMGCYVILFLMATQSAYFGPSKYGIVPEIVTSDRISKANGLLTMFTFLAIIVGTFLASFITQVSGRDFIIAAMLCTCVALAGFISSFYISYTPPAGSDKKLNPLVPYVIYSTLKKASERHCLLTAAFGSAYMMFIGAFFQLNIIPFAMQCLHLSDVEGGYLFLLTALGIGTGSVLAGKLSGRFVELGLVPFAGIGIILCYFGIDYYSESLSAAIILTLLVGVFGGIFVIPFDTFIQVTSPN